MSVIWVSKNNATKTVKNRIIKTEVVLDIGPGIRPQAYFRPRLHICVEPHLQYIERLRQDIENDPAYIFLNCTWDVALNVLPSKSVDSVFALDVIEHFDKRDGFLFLREAERVARRQVIISTPLGYYPQDYDDSNKKDRWGMEGGYWQAHRSGWLVEDFGEDWDLVCCEAYHFVDQHEQVLEKPFGVIWAFRNLADTSTSHTYRRWHAASVFRQHMMRRLKHLLRFNS